MESKAVHETSTHCRTQCSLSKWTLLTSMSWNIYNPLTSKTSQIHTFNIHCNKQSPLLKLLLCIPDSAKRPRRLKIALKQWSTEHGPVLKKPCRFTMIQWAWPSSKKPCQFTFQNASYNILIVSIIKPIKDYEDMYLSLHTITPQTIISITIPRTVIYCLNVSLPCKSQLL